MTTAKGPMGLSAKLRAHTTMARQRMARRLDPLGQELLYQASYLDLARRTPWIDETPLSSPGGGTASFSQLYLLLRILTGPARISRVLELGVGVSTHLIAQWVRAHDGTSVHVDDDCEWLEATVPDHDRITRIHAKLSATVVGERTIEWYDAPQPSRTFDLVLVDGPQAWTAGTRYNRLGVLQWLPDILAEEFIVLVDDASRPGERELVDEIEKRLAATGRSVARRPVLGGNSQELVMTDRFRFAAYL